MKGKSVWEVFPDLKGTLVERESALSFTTLKISVGTKRRDIPVHQGPFWCFGTSQRGKRSYPLMAPIRKGVTEFIRASKSLLALEDLSEEEEEAVKEMLWQLSIRFPDEGDDAAD